MSPDRNRSRTPAQKRRKFKELLEDVETVDSKVLRLFPSMDFEGMGIGAQVKKGLQTALRALLVAAEDGYVNENELSKYGVGGDSRHRVLPRLCDLGLLVRSEEVSLKGGTKFVHRLSGKGVVLCAAFPRIFKSRDLFVTLIKKSVADKSLAHTMLTLYLEQSDPRKNRLLKSLHCASNAGMNIEHVSGENLAKELLQAEETMSTDPQEALLFKLGEEFVNWLSSAGDKEVTDMRHSVSEVVEMARSQPTVAKQVLIGLREGLQFLRSSDFQVWARASNRNMKHLQEIALEALRDEAGDIARDYSALSTAWAKRRRILDAIRRRLREESYSLITKRLGEMS